MQCSISLCEQVCHCEFVISALNPAMLPQKSLTSRSKVNCPLLGISADLKANVLPTTHDLLKYFEPTLAFRKHGEMAHSRW